MEQPWTIEWRLAHVAVLNALVLAGAARWVWRRRAGDAFDRITDTLLLWLAMQYAAVGVMGILGVLDAWSISGMGVVLGAALWLGAGGGIGFSAPKTSLPRPSPSCAGAWDQTAAWSWVGLIGGCLGWLTGWQWPLPPVGDDVLTYHLPAAARWLQTGRFALLETWYFNPANTYSPLGGSIFAAWWMAPMGDDWLGRFVQVPALVLIFFAMLRLGRQLGLPVFTAGAVASAAVLCRPIIAQTVLAKDDLYLAGFFLVALTELGRREADRWSDALGGIALGLLLSIKVTALLSLPVLALVWRWDWSWRRYAWIAGGALVLAGGWYARTAWWTGNPLYPTRFMGLPGLFSVERSDSLRSIGGIWNVLAGGYLGIPLIVLLALGTGWVGAWGALWRRVGEDALARACLLGPVVGLGVFIAVAPYAEVRFLYPTILVGFGAVAAVLSVLRDRWMQAGVGVALVGVSLWTAFKMDLAGPMSATGICVGLVVLVVAWGVSRWPVAGGRAMGYLAGALGLGAGLMIYVHAPSANRFYAMDAPMAWEIAYGDLASAWRFVREETPTDATIAYANTYLVYPLYGRVEERRVVYAPVRPGVDHLSDLPPLPGKVNEQTLRPAIVREMNAMADSATWWRNLERSGADYLFIAKHQAGEAPPEGGFAEQSTGRLERIFENDAAVVFRMDRPTR